MQNYQLTIRLEAFFKSIPVAYHATLIIPATAFNDAAFRRSLGTLDNCLTANHIATPKKKKMYVLMMTLNCFRVSLEAPAAGT